MTYHYAAFGLHIRSVLPLPELTRVEESSAVAPDLTIRYGDVPEVLRGGVTVGGVAQVGCDEVLVRRGERTGFVISGSDTIRVARHNSREALRFYLLGSGFGIVLHRKGKLPLHASGVADERGRALLFTGRQGSGKSTMAALLAARGFRFLTDDLAAVDVAQPAPLVFPGYPQQRLDGRSVALVAGAAAERSPVPEPLGEHPLRDKRVYGRPEHFESAPAEVHAVLILKDGLHVRARRLSPREALPSLLQHTYRKRVAAAMGAQYLHSCRDLAPRVPVWILERPRDPAAAGELVRCIAALLD